MSKLVSLCSSCHAKNNEKFKSDCMECKASGMNKTEVFTKGERKATKNMLK